MPSNAILEAKQQAVAELTELIKASAGGVIVNYQGITVDKDTAMRKALREAGVKYMVREFFTTMYLTPASRRALRMAVSLSTVIP